MRESLLLAIVFCLSGCPSMNGPPPMPADLTEATCDGPCTDPATDGAPEEDLASSASDLAGADLAGPRDLAGPGDLASPSAKLRHLYGEPNHLWVVGDRGFIARWQGTTWAQVPSGTAVDLHHVWSQGANLAWAVGASGTILRWNGAAWSAVAGGAGYDLCCVHGTGANDAWIAVRTSRPLMGRNHELTFLRWNGTAWTPYTATVLVSRGSRPVITTIWGTSPNEYSAGGTDGVEINARWNGTAWSAYEGILSSSQVAQIWGAGPGDIWIGSNQAPFAMQQVIISNTSGRADRPSARYSNYVLLALAGSGANDVWAYLQPAFGGSYIDAQFDGTKWQTRTPAQLRAPLFVESPGRFWSFSGRTISRKDGAAPWAAIWTAP